MPEDNKDQSAPKSAKDQLDTLVNKYDCLDELGMKGFVDGGLENPTYLVLEKVMTTAYPQFRLDRDMVVPTNYLEDYVPMTITEFVQYLDEVETTNKERKALKEKLAE